MLYGSLRLCSGTDCTFGPFRPPKRAKRKAYKVRRDRDNYEMSLRFIGNGYLKLMVPREILFKGHGAPLASAPEMFEFVGIWRDREKEKAEEEERMRVEKARQPPSPRESWFEMNHPMGWWHQSRGRF